MTDAGNRDQQKDLSAASYDPEMESILKQMLESDDDITARGVIRLHSKLSAASSITRNPTRSKMLAIYQAKQAEFRRWRKRLSKRSKDSSAMGMAEKDIRISELERQVELLTASHVAMLRAVGELGGFAKWAKFFSNYQEIRNEIAKMGAMPDAKIF
ncbi:MAG: hypothetical protein WC825_03350 [Gallionellaceae bacterium]|jgi:hypothetical protein